LSLNASMQTLMAGETVVIELVARV
jgi:hypothetical protein